MSSKETREEHIEYNPKYLEKEGRDSMFHIITEIKDNKIKL